MEAAAKPELVSDTYVSAAPHAQNMLDLFEGEWASQLPPPFEALQAGGIPLFQDSRIHWMLEELRGVGGFRVLELGPLEAGHSYLLDRAGAMEVLAIEANRRAFLKCLVIKELMGMPSVRFALGDFNEFLEQTDLQWDLCVASGVLYHMREPVELLRKLGAHADRLFLWTHYYDETICQGNPNLKMRFGAQTSRSTGSFRYKLQRFNYMEALDGKGFCGGSAVYSQWLTRPAIFEALRLFGFRNVTIGHDTPQHPHGPCFAIVATK